MERYFETFEIDTLVIETFEIETFETGLYKLEANYLIFLVKFLHGDSFNKIP